MKDAEARRAIREDLDRTLWVEAAAGTGKTTELVRRVVGLVSTGRARMPGLALVTFTEKAASELEQRLRAELEAARGRAVEPVRDRLDAAIRELELARIGTIHAFCAELLRERPIEAGLDPGFEVLGDHEEERLFDGVFRRWLATTLEDPPAGVRRALRRPPDRWGVGPVRRLRDAGRAVAQRRDFDGAWTRPPFDREAAIDGAIEAIGALARWDGRAARADDPLAKTARGARRWLDDLARRERTEPRDHDGLEAALPLLLRHPGWDWRRRGRPRFAPDVPREVVDADRAHLRETLEALAVACDQDLAAALFEDLRGLVAGYDDEKRRVGALDYVDLLVLARRLLVEDPRLRAHLQAAITHVFVDEFQDTDPLQADILLLLAADDPATSDPAEARPAPGKLFVVGDPKQAIYRFRRADVACYLALRERLVAQGAALVQLVTSFRSDPRLQAAVNGAFAPRMSGGVQADYVPLEPYRAADPARPALVALPVPDAQGGVTDEGNERSLPQAVANWIEWLLGQSGWTVSEADHDGPVPIAARHVCLLFRSTRRLREDLVGPYARALEARGIPHAVVGGRAFHDRDEVQALRNALRALEWPDDALAVYATLKGPLFALEDDRLFLWKARTGTLDPTHRPEPALDDPAREDLEAVRDALAVLAQARRGRNRRPISATIHQLLLATRAHAGFAASVGGDQVLANALRVGQLARRFEARGAASFRAFVDALDDEAARNEAPDAPIVEDGTDGVRLMTVHKSKGLEFPVVVLADLTTPHTLRRPSRFLDPARRVWAMPLCGCVPHDLRRDAEAVLEEDRAEADRIAYVAATRARDVLVVPTLAGYRSWLDPLGEVLDREAVRWAELGDTRAWEGGVRRVELLAEEGDGGASARRYEDWRAPRRERIARASRPSVQVVLATDVRGVAGEVAIERTEVAREGRPYGPRFGSLVHACLAQAPFDGGGLAELVALHGRILGATPEERTAAVAAVAAALAHPLIRRAAASPDCRREVPVAWRDGERLVEGVADLAFRDVSGWVVVDFKTDQDVRAHLSRYRGQLAAYAAAVSAATGAPAVATLFLV